MTGLPLRWAAGHAPASGGPDATAGEPACTGSELAPLVLLGLLALALGSRLVVAGRRRLGSTLPQSRP